jgi:hypothetical protein
MNESASDRPAGPRAASDQGLAGKVAIVTGGASGIGLGIVLRAGSLTVGSTESRQPFAWRH